MKRIAVVLLFCLLGWLAFRAVKGPRYTNFPPKTGTTWVAFGDSLTSGAGASPEHDYPTLLGAQLGIKIINCGLPGNTSQDGLDRIEEILRLNPKVVLLCLGGNDGLRGLPAEQMFRNLGTIIDRFHEAGAFVVLVGVRSGSVFDKNDSGFNKLGKQKQVLYVPNILQGVLGDPRLMADYIHPNDAGNKVIAYRLGVALRPLLSKLL
ncbi:MAG: arylesterase [Verrucomicrobia bacterium]|nr:arylesterase [Verrucomicrobiota bacterium]